MRNFYEKLMKKCITLAKKGRGKTSPNPMVGCIVLDKNNEIISAGYHHQYGKNHAERYALLKLKKGEEKDGTLIVNLEPCSHYGKTPPCVDLIIERKIKKVVIGCKDNNPKVCGNGIKKLINAGVEVIIGILENDCRQLNEIFFTDVEEHRTFVAVKTATTIDGKISTSTGDSKWITSEKARNYARNLRGNYDAILTSYSTVLADNPEMKHKLKIIIDKNFNSDFSYNIFKTGEIILALGENTKANNLPPNVTVIKCKTKNNQIDIMDLLAKLYERNIKSVFVEAGEKLCGSFIKENAVDKIFQFIAPKVLNDNTGKSCMSNDKISTISKCKQFKITNFKRIGSDLFVEYSKTY